MQRLRMLLETSFQVIMLPVDLVLCAYSTSPRTDVLPNQIANLLQTIVLTIVLYFNYSTMSRCT